MLSTIFVWLQRIQESKYQIKIIISNPKGQLRISQDVQNGVFSQTIFFKWVFDFKEWSDSLTIWIQLERDTHQDEIESGKVRICEDGLNLLELILLETWRKLNMIQFNGLFSKVLWNNIFLLLSILELSGNLILIQHPQVA